MDIDAKGYAGPAGVTSWHTDGGGSLDASHSQLKGYSHVIMLKRGVDLVEATSILKNEAGAQESEGYHFPNLTHDDTEGKVRDSRILFAFFVAW